MPTSDELITATGADVFVNRMYWNVDDSDLQIQMHVTVFSDLEKGMKSHPMKTLQADGWKLLVQNRDSVATCNDKTIPVSLSEWEKNYKAVMVLFWYQLGDRVFSIPRNWNRCVPSLATRTRPALLSKCNFNSPGAAPKWIKNPSSNLPAKLPNGSRNLSIIRSCFRTSVERNLFHSIEAERNEC